MPAVETIFAALENANQYLYQENVANMQAEGRAMGTTLVGYWQFVPGAPIVVLNIGDSHLYLYRDGQLTQLTKDQTLYQQAIDMGQTEYLPPRNLLLQAVGPSADVTPEMFTHPTKVGDIYPLCSDALHSYVNDSDIGDILRQTNAGTLAQSCSNFIALANRHGGRDNTTVLLAICTA
jgi:serine/threonine protein phosphatase PrpC